MYLAIPKNKAQTSEFIVDEDDKTIKKQKLIVVFAY